MIDSNNQFNKLSASLVAATRSIMEKKTNKHGHDPVGKEDADIDNDGDVDGSDKYLHNRRKAIAKNMKKEEVERIDELSRKTLSSYVDKASQSAADHGYQYGRKKAEADEMDRMMNRHMSFADKDKVRDVMKTTTKDVEAPHRKAGRRLQGITRAASRLAKEEVERIDELSTDTLKSYDRQRSGQVYSGGGNKPSDINKLNRQRNSVALARTKVNRVHQTGSSVLNKEEVELDEALDAAARYGQHHTAIKELMKSIDHHVRNHKDDALKHKNYQGKKGVHWGHVGDLAQVHSQLADIHDRLAQQGEYKKSMHESVEDLDIEQIDELSKATMGSYVKKAADDFQKRKPKMGYDGQLKKMQNRKVGVNRAIDKMYGEEVEAEFTQEELDYLDVIAAELELDEARGRPRKNPLPAGKETEEPEPRQHIMQQLERAKISMRGGEHVTFKDGTKHHVPGQHAAKLLGKYSDMKPYEKEAFQKKIGQSHANLKSEL